MGQLPPRQNIGLGCQYALDVAETSWRGADEKPLRTVPEQRQVGTVVCVRTPPRGVSSV